MGQFLAPVSSQPFRATISCWFKIRVKTHCFHLNRSNSVFLHACVCCVYYQEVKSRFLVRDL